jgi:hypothetical protein
MRLAKDLPRDKTIPANPGQAAEWQRAGRAKLQAVTHAPVYQAEAEQVGEPEGESITVTRFRLHMDDSWTVPAVEMAGPSPQGTVLIVADGGRTSVAGEVRSLLRQGRRVIAIDPFYFGESKIETEDFLFAILIAAVGERPLGVQAGQIAAAARWAQSLHGAPVEVHAVGPRTSLAALIAGALETQAISGLRLDESFSSLREVVERDLGANQTPELFCFGLLEAFDIPQIAALSAPRKVEFLGR